MKNPLIVCLLSLIAPAYASTGLTPVIVFTTGTTTALNITWTNSSNIQSPQFCFDFTPTNNDWVPSHYQSTGSGAGYTYNPPTPPAQPNVAAFIAALRSESSFTSAIRATLVPWYAIFQADVNNSAALQQDWSDFIANNSTIITSDVQTTILNYAQTYNIPLTSTQ